MKVISNVCLNEASSVATLDWELGQPYYAPHPNITFKLRVFDLLPTGPMELGVVGKVSVKIISYPYIIVIHN